MSDTISSRRALLAYALGLCFFCYAFVQRVLPSVMIDGFATDLAVGGATLGVLSGAYFYAYAMMQIPVGMLIDRYGPRLLLSLAMLVCVFGSGWMASSESLIAAALARALIGAAVAFGFVGTLAIIGRYFAPNRFALLAGLLQSAGMVGAVLGQAPLRLLVEQLSWRGALWSLAALALLLATVLWLYLPKHSATQSVKSHGGSRSRGGLLDVLRHPQNWLGAGLGFGLCASMLAFSGLWAVPWLEQVYGLPTATAASLASMTFIGNAVASPLLGWWSDRIQRRRPALLLGAFAGLTGTTAIIYGGQWSPVALAILFFYIGLAPAAIPITFATVRELNRPALVGTTLGLVNMFVVGSGAVLQPLIGALLDRQQATLSGVTNLSYTAADYSWAMSTLVVANTLALLCAIMIRESKCKNISTD